MSCMQHNLLKPLAIFYKSIYEALKRLSNENTLNVIFYFTNINSIRYKFEDLKFFYMNNVDISLIGETKLDSSLPDAYFFIEGYYNKSFRLDVSGRSRGLLVYPK